MSDYISRAAAIESFDDPRVERNYGDVDPDSVIRVIEAIPAADVQEVKRGRWIAADEQPYFRKHYHTMVCSECGKRRDGKWHYCPNCGAKMEDEA